jgi:hypothetical protein
MQDNFTPILQKIDLVIAEQAQISASGPHFVIVSQCSCQKSERALQEEVGDILLLHHGRRFSLPLSRRLGVLFDYLGRHRHLAQSATQIAIGMSVDASCRRGGERPGTRGGSRITASRTAVKQQILRLRQALSHTFDEAALTLEATRVLVSQETVTNEVRYRLKARIDWVSM